MNKIITDCVEYCEESKHIDVTENCGGQGPLKGGSVLWINHFRKENLA